MSLNERAARQRWRPPRSFCDFLLKEDTPVNVDLLFALAGRPERKSFALELFRDGFARRFVLSVGRFEVRQVARLGLEVQPDLRELARRTPPIQRHFFVDFFGGSPRVIVRGDAGQGTYAELRSLADYLGSEAIKSIMLVSTSIHLRRVALSCGRIPFFRGKSLNFVPVPEALSSFRRSAWWRRGDHWSYLIAEYAKLMAYMLRLQRR